MAGKRFLLKTDWINRSFSAFAQMWLVNNEAGRIKVQNIV